MRKLFSGSGKNYPIFKYPVPPRPGMERDQSCLSRGGTGLHIWSRLQCLLQICRFFSKFVYFIESLTRISVRSSNYGSDSVRDSVRMVEIRFEWSRFVSTGPDDFLCLPEFLKMSLHLFLFRISIDSSGGFESFWISTLEHKFFCTSNSIDFFLEFHLRMFAF